MKLRNLMGSGGWSGAKAVLALCLAVVFALSGRIWAQAGIDTGSITGTVKDPSGAVVAGANCTLVNKATGTVMLEYGPAMMWNTQYGMMRQMMGYQQPSGAMTVSAAQATQIARQWLAQHQQPCSA